MTWKGFLTGVCSQLLWYRKQVVFVGHEESTLKLEFLTLTGISETLSGDLSFDYENHTYLLVTIN